VSEGIVIGFKCPEMVDVEARTNMWVNKHGVVQLVETIITECV
jgi:hypothetical protein